MSGYTQGRQDGYRAGVDSARALAEWLLAESEWKRAQVQSRLERLENAALDPNRLYSGVLVGVGGEHDVPPNDEQCKRAAKLIGDSIRRAADPGYYITHAERRLLKAIGSVDDAGSGLSGHGVESGEQR
jgi:hypothetical protein